LIVYTACRDYLTVLRVLHDAMEISRHLPRQWDDD
jgi:hypothetical protein